MSLRPEILVLIIACMVVTVVPRILPMALVHKLKLPPSFLAWLAYIPVAVISPLFFKEMLIGAEGLRAISSEHFIAGCASLVIAFVSRSIALTVVASMSVFALVRMFL